MQAVSVGQDVRPFHVVQNERTSAGEYSLWFEERDEISDRALEVDVVFPQRIVGIDKQRLRAI